MFVSNVYLLVPDLDPFLSSVIHASSACVRIDLVDLVEANYHAVKSAIPFELVDRKPLLVRKITGDR